MNYRTKASLFRFGLYAFLWIVVLFCLFPVAWMIIISFKQVGESITGFNALRIHTPTLANYKRLFELIPIWRNLYNRGFTRVDGNKTQNVFC